MALTATLDKTSYNSGDTITLTVTSDKRLTSTTLDITAGGDDVKVTTIVQTSVTLTDPANRTWTKKSDDGKVAVYTTTA